MNIINQSDFENEKRRCEKIESCTSFYLAAGYIIFIGFLCIVGGSIIQLVEGL